MAFERLEPFGALVEEFRMGQVASTIANFAGLQRNSDLPALQPADFSSALRRATDLGEEPLLFDTSEMDPEALSRLIDATVFGVVH